uniref:G-protein coupled receptors family 3 profile domain-containing protein n=1 Tax=Strigamia maritima TaxID=126957 RepID=T1JM77_STRMM
MAGSILSGLCCFVLLVHRNTAETDDRVPNATKLLSPLRIVTIQNVSSGGTSAFRLRDQVWVVPLIVFASLNLIVFACFEAFVLVKMVNARPSRRHFFLGQMLLLGLFLSSLVSFAYVTPPNLISCTVIRLGVGLSYTVIFATMMVKLVFLISLNNGVYLPAPYHGLLLFFAIAVQVAIGIQWLIQRPPALVFTSTSAICNTSFHDTLLSLIYVMFLLVFITFLSIKSHGIRDNYREAMYIGLSVGCCIPMWVTWTVIALVLRDGYEEPSLAFGLVINSTLTFIIMFVPKGRQLAALGKEGLYFEDQEREEHLSSISLPSIYTPSFYHFKPHTTAFKSSMNTDIFKYGSALKQDFAVCNVILDS